MADHPDNPTLQRELEQLRERYSRIEADYRQAIMDRQESELHVRKLDAVVKKMETQRDELIVDKIDLRTALEELKAAQEELIDSNERLKLAHTELDHKNEQLIVRGIELRTALEELKASQEELLRTEKMSALGHVITNIAHEVNTPIGAIYAASQNVSRMLPTLLDTFPELFKEMPLELKPMFFELIDIAKTNSIGEMDTRTERQNRNDIQDQLDQLSVARSSELARMLAKIGIKSEVERYIPLITDTFSERLVSSAMAIGRLKANIDTIGGAIHKTQRVILALKSYLEEDLTPQMGGTIEFHKNLDEVVQYYKGLHNTRIEVVADYSTNLPLVTCYPDQLRQVWNNLILNAIQAVNGGGTVTVSAHKVADRDAIQVTVRDTGPGIPQRLIFKIFDAFFTTRPEGEGSGLGLYVARKIVNRHKGTLEVLSEPGNTTFTVVIPTRI